jgi:integrase
MFAATVEVSMARGEYVAPAMGRVTVAEIASAWLGRKECATAPSHYRTLEPAWRVHVKPHWGSVPLADIDVLGVEQWITALITKGAGTTTILRAYGVLSGMLSDAVKGKRLAANPAKSVDNLPRKTARRHVYLSADDVHRFADESGGHRALVLTLAYCGIRWGEAIGLRVRDVEFLRRRLTVSENAVQIGSRHVVGLTKGRKCRSVPVPEFVLTELAKGCEGKAPGDLVFSTAGGDYLQRPKSSNGWFQAAVKRAAVESITPHSLRHTYASALLGQGVPLVRVASLLGHTPEICARTYAHWIDDTDSTPAEILERARERQVR